MKGRWIVEEKGGEREREKGREREREIERRGIGCVGVDSPM